MLKRGRAFGAFTSFALAAMVIVAPPVRAAERYVDPVFSSVKATTNIAYGQAERYNGETQTLHLDLFEAAWTTSCPRRPS